MLIRRLTGDMAVLLVEHDIDRVLAIWSECFERYGGPYLFGNQPCMADAMYAPVCSRVTTYGIALDATPQRYVDTVMAMPEMIEWVEAASAEPDEIIELDSEF